MKNNIEERLNATDMSEKTGLGKRNSFLDSVIWRNWILPIGIGLIAGGLFKIAFIAM